MTKMSEAEAHLLALVDSMIWMSGSESFGPDGEAHEGWVNVARPRLFAAMEYLNEEVE